MTRRNPKPGQIYKHFKDRLYQIITVANHSETGEKMVVYQALYPDFQTYVRPLDMFMSEVDKNKYPGVQQKYRFEEVTELTQNTAFEKSNENEEKLEVDKVNSMKQEDCEAIEGVNPVLIQFLDAVTLHDKMRVLCDNKKRIDKKCISDMAVSLDITIQENDLEKQIEELESCLEMMKRFEVNRLR